MSFSLRNTNYGPFSSNQISLTQGGLLSCKFINFHMNESQQSQQLASMMSLLVYMSINKHLLSTL